MGHVSLLGICRLVNYLQKTQLSLSERPTLVGIFRRFVRGTISSSPGRLVRVSA